MAYLKNSVAYVLAGLLAGVSLSSHAAPDSGSYPDKAVRIVVPVAAGGSADKLTRIIAERLSAKWGQPVTVENVVGASGTIGAAKVAKARPDGYTLLQSGEGITLNSILFDDLSFDASKAFVPVIKAVVNPQILVVNPALGVKTFQDYVALTKSKPGAVSLALPGRAGIAHVAHTLLDKETGGKVTYVPYPGGGPAAVDVIAGHANATLITLAAVTEYVKAGRLTPIAVTTSYRSKALPDVPTIAESGLPSFKVESWQGYLAPAGTPPAIVRKLNQDIASVLQTPDIKARLEELGFGIAGGSPADLDATLKSELPRYAQVIKESGIKVR